ncbi:hypothetical protein ACLOJK_033956 [Asimina triloba]
MQIGSTTASTSAPAQIRTITIPRTAFATRLATPLKMPQRTHRMAARIIKNHISVATPTRTHLASLEKLLEKTTDPLPSEIRNNTPGEAPQENRLMGAFDVLGLNGIWPGPKVADEMSPRSLDELQRLLTRSPQRSPKNPLGGRWQEYHGRDDWAGLLDPLDENLRREVVRYGEFVQAAYRSFQADPAAGESSPRSHVELPDKSYRVTKPLYATSSTGLPTWVDDVAPELGWMTQRTSRIGYVAVCEDPREIARMGRRDIVVALRGTCTCLEWAENLRVNLVPVSSSDAKVECGFWSLLKTAGPHGLSLCDSLAQEVQRLVEKYKGEELSITVTGHSLGAAIAILAADELRSCVPSAPPVAVFSFGGPRVGNGRFAERVAEKGAKVLRIVNAQDVVTRVPGVFASEEYSHVGTELRVDTRSSPFLKPNADMACSHDLEAYLHLVDGFLGSSCPFRSNAKRSIRRLVHAQGSNMKKLYTKKVLTTLNVETEGIGALQ